MDIISIQSQVVYGHVGNSAAVYPLQAKGFEVAAVPTALLSNHPHYPTMHGQILGADLVAGLLLGLEERGVVDTARVIMTGFLGTVETALVVAEFIERVLKRNPSLTYVCDPVMGDDDLGLFVKEGLVEVFTDRLVPLAAMITPNQYELELLTKREARSLKGLEDAMRLLARYGINGAAVTGCVFDDSRAGCVETVSWTPQKTTRTAVERLPIRPCGTGDLFTALLVADWIEKADLHAGSARATHEIHSILRRTHQAESEEMRIIGFDFGQPAASAVGRAVIGGGV